VYADAFSEKSKEKLKSLDCEILYLSRKDAEQFALNSIAIDDDILVHAAARNFQQILRKRGFTVHCVDIGEFIKFGGGLKCLTFQHYL
jgi:N-dimethylarginine dimethylaminohydrolase